MGKFNIIRNNNFNNITNYVFDFMKSGSSRHGGGLLITENKINGLKNTMFSGNYLEDVIISKNQIETVSVVPSTLITSNYSNGLIIVGNTLPSGVSISKPVTANNTTNMVNASNSWN